MLSKTKQTKIQKPTPPKLTCTIQNWGVFGDDGVGKSTVLASTLCLGGVEGHMTIVRKAAFVILPIIMIKYLDNSHLDRKKGLLPSQG